VARIFKVGSRLRWLFEISGFYPGLPFAALPSFGIDFPAVGCHVFYGRRDVIGSVPHHIYGFFSGARSKEEAEKGTNSHSNNNTATESGTPIFIAHVSLPKNSLGKAPTSV